MDKGKLITNALVSKSQENENWFSQIRNSIFKGHIDPNIDFETFIDEWIIECDMCHSTSVKDQIVELVRQLNN